MALQQTRGQPLHPMDWDTYSGGASYDVARLATGSFIRMIDLLFEGSIDTGFAVVRPPGHHAEPGKAMGFCLFNNIAVGAQWALDQGLVRRVAIIDFDVHHGNGTQTIFYHRPDVLYVSLHQYPLYPGTGYYTELGEGKGKGKTLNFPIPAGRGNRFYLALISHMVIPVLSHYKPDLILVSAGYDAHRNDPLAGMNLDEQGYAQMTLQLNSIAREICDGRILYILEGGYNLEALAASVEATIVASLKPEAPEPKGKLDSDLTSYWDQLQPVLSRYWPLCS